MPLSVEEKFNKAVAYVQGLPKDGPYQPSQDTKLQVRLDSLLRSCNQLKQSHQYYAYYKQGLYRSSRRGISLNATPSNYRGCEHRETRPI